MPIYEPTADDGAISEEDYVVDVVSNLMVRHWRSLTPGAPDWSETLVLTETGILWLKYQEPPSGVGYAPEFSNSDKLGASTRIASDIFGASGVVVYAYETLLAVCPMCMERLMDGLPFCEMCGTDFCTQQPIDALPPDLVDTYIVAVGQSRRGPGARRLYPALLGEGERPNLAGPRCDAGLLCRDVGADLSRPWRQLWENGQVHVPAYLHATYWSNYMPLYEFFTGELPGVPVRKELAGQQCLAADAKAAPLCVDAIDAQFFAGTRTATAVAALKAALKSG